jgi:hypothetical protein
MRQLMPIFYKIPEEWWAVVTLHEISGGADDGNDRIELNDEELAAYKRDVMAFMRWQERFQGEHPGYGPIIEDDVIGCAD